MNAAVQGVGAGSRLESLDAAALQPGARINEYTIQRVLGVGGFGITYLARDENLALTVALKEYFPSPLASRTADGRVQPRSRSTQVVTRFQNGLHRFVEEARALATFRHPHIVRVLRYFEAQGTACIVMEYETGQSLRHWMASRPPLRQQQLLALVRPLMDGLEAVHAAGFLHRDIKPDNIFVRAGGSPVLLDFGAARRFCAGQDLTNVVSPGFAPFEQYHTGGHQGPWTDLYSLGAVMYWLATAERPLDAASRMKSDTMPRFSDLADSTAFEPELVRVVDWCLLLEEKRRPQSVPELRSALGVNDTAPPAEPPPGPSPLPAGRPDALDDAPFAVACGRRNILCTILFIDMVGYSTLPVDEQVAIKQLTNRLVARAMQSIPHDNRLAIDTGDGAAICCVADPEQMLDAALVLRSLLLQHGRSRLRARMGLHLGPVRIVSDINDRRNVVGDGINVAQRVMDFAQGNQILVSTAFHEAMARTSDGAAALFRYLGPHQDKHGRVHELHAVTTADPRRPALRAREARNGVPTGGYAVADASADDITLELSRLIGPIARVLVDKTRGRVTSAQGLRNVLAPFVPDAVGRERFLGGLPGTHSTTEPSTPAARLGTPISGAVAPRLRKASQLTPLHEVAPSVSRRTSLNPNDLPVIERLLGEHIGPMARVLLARERDAGLDGRELINALAEHIGGEVQRERFRRAVQRQIAKLAG